MSAAGLRELGDPAAPARTAAATARTNPTISGPQSSGAARRAAVNHRQFNDLQILNWQWGEKAALEPPEPLYLLDLTDPLIWALRLTQQTKEIECARMCVSCVCVCVYRVRQHERAW